MNDEYELKKYEELYSLSKSELEKEHARFVSIEEKATKLFSVLAVFLAFAAAGIPEYVSIARMQTTWLHMLFISTYSMLALSMLASLFYYVKSISFSKFKNIVLNEEMFTHFKKNRYIDVVFSMSKRFADDLRVLNKATDKKIVRVTLAFQLTEFSLLLVVLTITLYIAIKLR